MLVSVAPVFARRPTLTGTLDVAGTSDPAGCPGVVGVGYGLLGSGWGEYPDTPNGITTRKFRDTIRKWKRMIDSLGVGVLQHKTKKKKWNLEEKLVLISKILAGYSYNSVALENGIII